MSESAKYRHLTQPYCVGNGLDVGSGGDPVVPWAIQVDLPDDKFRQYNQRSDQTIHWRGDCTQLPFHNNCLGFIYSSHLIEDFPNWAEIVRYWMTLIRKGGHLVILVPDRELFQAAIKRGHPGNSAHVHEFTAGELTFAISLVPGWQVITDRRTEAYVGDYSILFVAQKIS